MALSNAQLQQRCLLHCGAQQCRYLVASPKKYGQYDCGKQVSTYKQAADKRVKTIISVATKAGIQPHQQWEPIGDGGVCKGYPYLPGLKQGFDVKNP